MLTTQAPEQNSAPDSGLLCLALLARYHSVAAEPAQMRHELGLSGAATCEDLLLAAKGAPLGQQLRARSGPLDLERAAQGKLPLPCIVEMYGPLRGSPQDSTQDSPQGPQSNPEHEEGGGIAATILPAAPSATSPKTHGQRRGNSRCWPKWRTIKRCCTIQLRAGR